MGNLTTAVDFGSSKIAVAVGQKTAAGIKIIFYNETPTTGIRAGEIINDKKVCDALMSLIRKAEGECGERIESAVIAISDKFLKSKDVVAHSIRKDYDKFIDADEILCLSALQNDSEMDSDDVIFEAIPQKFDVDDQIGLKIDDVIGMKGSEIDGFFKIYYGKKSHLERRRGILNECNIRMEKAIPAPAASARAVLTQQEMENGVVLVDIGKGLTEIAIVKDGIIREMTTIPFGGESVSNDIKNVTGITYDWAESIKKRYGSALEDYTPENKLLIMHGNDNVEEGTVELSLLSRIIEARLSEIFDAVSYFIASTGYQNKIPSGIVLTGGTAYMEHIKPLAKALLGCRIRLAAPHGSITMDSALTASDTTASTAVGLILEAIDHKLSYAKECRIRVARPTADADPVQAGPSQQPQKPVSHQPKEARESQARSTSNPLKRFAGLFDFVGSNNQDDEVDKEAGQSPEDMEIERERAQKRQAEAEERAERERIRREEEEARKEQERLEKEETKRKKEEEKMQKEREKRKGLSDFFGGLFDNPNNEA